MLHTSAEQAQAGDAESNNRDRLRGALGLPATVMLAAIAVVLTAIVVVLTAIVTLAASVFLIRRRNIRRRSRDGNFLGLCHGSDSHQSYCQEDWS